MKERTLLSIKLILSHILLLPFLLAISILLPSMSIYLVLIVQTLLIIIYLTGYWEFFGLRFRISYFVFIEFLIVLLMFRQLHLHINTPAGWPALLIFPIFEVYLIYQLFNIFYVTLKRDKDSLEISFPLKEGKILVTDGGNSKVSRLMNYHYYSKVHKRKGTHLSMKFATDIVRIDPPLKSFLPANNPDYPVFENIVYSPISGSVFKVINDIKDNIPYSGNYPYNTGNTIVIRNADLYFLIGHLKMGSITKKEGEIVSTGEMIARAGNSGYTERPHIHMQLIRSESGDYWFGRGVNMTYQQINLYKNRIISA